MRTRVKICGLTQVSDIKQAIDAGADALGFVTYNKSKRYVNLEQLQALRKAVPPFISAVVLVVNATKDQVEQIIQTVKPDLLQFHGDEPSAFCEQFAYPYIRAIRVGKVGLQTRDEIQEELKKYPDAVGFLFDSYTDSYGGTGKGFNWSVLQAIKTPNESQKIIVAGGINDSNIASLIYEYNPYAVDLSSAVEDAPGVKSPYKIKNFMSRLNEAVHMKSKCVLIPLIK